MPLKLQAIISWTAEDGSFVQRVVTRRLQVTVNRGAALRGVDCETSALLLAKRIVQEGRMRAAASSPKEAARLQRAIGNPSSSGHLDRDHFIECVIHLVACNCVNYPDLPLQACIGFSTMVPSTGLGHLFAQRWKQ